MEKVMTRVYPVTPVAKPRMTRRDKWGKRAIVKRYNAFKDQVRLYGIDVPECGYHVVFILPMPKSWSLKKRAEMDGKPHKVKPDKDNLEKALLDAIYGSDAHVWNG